MGSDVRPDRTGDLCVLFPLVVWKQPADLANKKRFNNYASDPAIFMYYQIRKNIKFLKWLGTIIKQCLLHILIFGIIKLQKHKYLFQIIADGYQDLALYLSQQCLLYLRSVNLGECWLTKLVNERDMIALHACSKIGIFYNVKHSYCLACWHFCLFFFMGGWYDWNNFCFLWRFSFTVTWFSYILQQG